MNELTGQNWKILVGDVLTRLRELPAQSVHCIVTSPPYWKLRDYQIDGQIGLEPTLAAFIPALVAVFRECRRVLRDDGTLWVNMGDNMIDKQVCGQPWRLAFALQDDGWLLRHDIIWTKRSPMPQSCTDRPTTAHEYIFLLTKRPSYFYDAYADRPQWTDTAKARRQYGDREMHGTRIAGAGRLDKRDKSDACSYPPNNADTTGRNLWSWWDDIGQSNFKQAHFATFPEGLPIRCIKLGTPEVGACIQCGMPWVRVVEKIRRPTRPGEQTKVAVPSGWDLSDGAHGSYHPEGRERVKQYRDITEVGNRDPQRHVTESRSVGWRPNCECYDLFYLQDFKAGRRCRAMWFYSQWFERLKRRAIPSRIMSDWPREPATVLDPFGGAMTTLVAARKLGRIGIGCELNPDYAQMGHDRVAGCLTDTGKSNGKRIESAIGQKEMFE